MEYRKVNYIIGKISRSVLAYQQNLSALCLWLSTHQSDILFLARYFSAFHVNRVQQLFLFSPSNFPT